MVSTRKDEPGTMPMATAFPAEFLDSHLGLFVLLGTFLVGVGLIAMFSSMFATLASVFLFGLLAVAAGVAEVILAFSSHEWGGRLLHVVIGILSIVAGTLMLRAPLMGASALTLVLAAWFLASGIGEVITALTERFHHWGVALFSGLIVSLLGVMLLAQWPVSGLWFIGLYIGVRFVMQGITWLSLAAAAHRTAGRLHAAV